MIVVETGFNFEYVVAAMELADRNVVVTGAGSGIGRALARRFAVEQPRALIVADLNLDAAETTAKEVGGMAVRVDVSREDEIRTLVDRAREVGGPIDVFFSNAGVPGPGGGPEGVGSSRVDLQACKLEYSIVSPK